MATDTGDSEVDPEELQRQLSQIKEAVGLKEQYGAEVESWLVVGVVVAVASALSQYVYTRGLPGSLYSVIWLGSFVVGFGAYSYWRGGSVGNPFASRDNRPNVNVVLGLIYLGSFPIQAVIDQFLPNLRSDTDTILALSVIVVMLGVGYLVVGYVLRAYYVRDRDRYAFYAGGVGMMALGVALPAYDLLRQWPYLVFGGGYLAYALATYGYLSWSE